MKSYWLGHVEEYSMETSHRKRKGKIARIADVQEKLLSETISSLAPKTVLEVGCGWGRMTRIVARLPTIERYDAIDISPERITEAETHISGVSFKAVDFMEDQRKDKYDLVFASEVLMHVPPNLIYNFMRKMREMSNRYVVSLDYRTEKYPHLWAHNFNHDYRRLYGSLDARGLEQKELKSRRFLGTETYPQSIFVADFGGSI